MSLSKDAIQMLRTVKRMVTHEPRRLNMAEWIVTDDALDPSDPLDNQFARDKAPRGFPKCGTVGCIGGWVETIYFKRTGHYRHAREILGLNWDLEEELCYPSDLMDDPKPQTVAHAKKVCAHIDAFIVKHGGAK